MIARLALTLGALGTATAAAQAPRPLVGPPVEFPEPFRSIEFVRAIRSGELLITGAARDDTSARGLAVTPRLYAVNFTAKSLRAVGRKGRDGDYLNVGRLLAAPGDTTWMTDEVRPRLLVITPDGEVAGTAPFPAHLLPEEGEANHSLRFLRTDTAGHFFDVRSPPAPFPDSTHRDSNVVRYRGRAGQPANDSLVWLYVVDRRTPAAFLGSSVLPYGLSDVWDVTAGGDVVVVRAEEYRVDRVTRSGELFRGAVIPYERLPVTAKDKRDDIAWRREGTKEAGFPDPGPVLERAEWATHKPPFTGAIVLSSDRVWVPITPRRDDDPVVYDVLDFNGTVRERVAMPRHTHVIALGPGVLYTARRDRTGLYLARWRWSPAP